MLGERQKDLEEAKSLAYKRKALLDKIRARSEQDLKEAKRLAADERKTLLDEIKADTTTCPSATAPTTREIPASLAKALDDAKADFTTWMKVHDEALSSYYLVLHEPPRIVL